MLRNPVYRATLLQDLKLLTVDEELISFVKSYGYSEIFISL